MKKIIKIFFSIIGILISCFFIWNRFIRERLPKDIYIALFSFRYYITFILLFVFIIMIIISLKNIFSINNGSMLNKVLFNKYFHYIYNNIIIPIKEGPEQLYELFYDSIKISFIIEPIHRFFFNYNIYNYAKYIVLFLKIWRIIVLFSFILDVFYFQQFYYLYKTLYILLIPLICNFSLFVINHHAKTLVEYLSNYIIVDYSEEENSFNIEKNPENENDIDSNTLRYYSDLYINACYTTKFFIELKEIKDEVNNYLNICIYTLYFITWFYCLYFSSNFYYKSPEIKVSIIYFIIILLSFIYNFTLLIYKNNINLFIHKKLIVFYEFLFIKRDNKHFLDFITDNIESNVLSFYCIFNVMPKYFIIVLFMFNNLLIFIPFILQISLLLLFLMFSSNLYLYLLNKYIDAELNILESQYYFITESNTTNIYFKFPSNKHIISEKVNVNQILTKWITIKETETFIYYSITSKTKFNRYMNCIYTSLLFITMLLNYLSVC